MSRAVFQWICAENIIDGHKSECKWKGEETAAPSAGGKCGACGGVAFEVGRLEYE